MFSYSQISRWLSFPIDPITVEDWLANREIFGLPAKILPDEAQLEIAYQIELARVQTSDGHSKDLPLEVLLNGLELSGLVDEKDYLIVAPSGKVLPGKAALEVQITVASEKPRKIKIPAMEFLVVPLSLDLSVKLEIRCLSDLKIQSKNDCQWNGSAKTKIIFDTRGRPIYILEGQKQQAFIAKLKQQLS